MYVLTKVVSGYEGSDVEVISASENLDLLNGLQTTLNFKLQHDVDAWNHFTNESYPQFLAENPRPSLDVDATENERYVVLQWMKKNTKICNDFKASDLLYDKQSSLSTLTNTYYEITEVPTPEELLREVSATL